MKNQKSNTNYADVLRNFEKAYNDRDNNPYYYTTALQELTQAIVYSVLKKLCNVGGVVTEETKVVGDSTKVVRGMRTDIAVDVSIVKRTQYAVNNATEYGYNADGELTEFIKDSLLNQSLTKLLSHSLSDGYDLIQTATVALLEESAKADTTVDCWLETPYVVHRLKKRVYIKKVDSVNGYEDVETTPIQEIYKVVRRAVADNRAIQISSHKYSYIDDSVVNPYTEEEERIYIRLPKYSVLATPTASINGKSDIVTTDITSVDTVNKKISELQLSTRQAEILKLRLSGYGYKAIATYLGVTQRAVAKTVKAIQEKYNNTFGENEV